MNQRDLGDKTPSQNMQNFAFDQGQRQPFKSVGKGKGSPVVHGALSHNSVVHRVGAHLRL